MIPAHPHFVVHVHSGSEANLNTEAQEGEAYLYSAQIN